MNNGFLVTRSEHDYPTRYLSTWAEKVIKVAHTKGKHVLDLFKEKANKKRLESMISKHQPTLVFLNGHGNEGCVTGHDNEPLIEYNNNESWLKDKVVYAVSCNSASLLGPSSVSKGAIAYIGYNREFAINIDLTKRTRCHEDKLAANFLEPSNIIMTSLIKKHTVAEAVTKGRMAFIRNMRKLSISTSTDKEKSAVPYLLWNMQALTFSGSKDAYIP